MFSGDETLDRPETDCADDHNAYGDKNRKKRNDIHFHYVRFTLKAGISQLLLPQFLAQRYALIATPIWQV